MMAKAEPATSCHLCYILPEELSTRLESCLDWKVECTVKVLDTAKTTYFCVSGWGPSGYSGIQQGNESRRIAIFSMWHSDDNSVELVSKGPDVTVEEFGGEGTGLKAIRPLNWILTTPVKFIVHGERKDDKWVCSCYIEHLNDVIFMASYKRGGPRPLNKGGFYSFIEDYARPPGSEGWKEKRAAELCEQWFEVDNIRRPIMQARFTKVEKGFDAFAADKAYAAVNGQVFMLSTGGDYSGPEVSSGTVLNKEPPTDNPCPGSQTTS